MADKCFDNSCCRAFWTDATGFASSLVSVQRRAVPPSAIEQLDAYSPLHVSAYPICATCPDESSLIRMFVEENKNYCVYVKLFYLLIVGIEKLSTQ